jgi:hypothetical protein
MLAGAWPSILTSLTIRETRNGRQIMPALTDLSTVEKRRRIRQYALQKLSEVRGHQTCSCHAMADIWGYATRFYEGSNNDEESYVEDVSFILAGVNEWCTGAADRNRVGATEFTDSGFKTEFRDGSNQVQHFSAGVMAGFQYGFWDGLLHRVIRPDTPEDTALNDKSCSMGAGLDGVGVSLDEVKWKIEKYVCEKACGVCNGGKGR